MKIKKISRFTNFESFLSFSSAHSTSYKPHEIYYVILVGCWLLRAEMREFCVWERERKTTTFGVVVTFFHVSWSLSVLPSWRVYISYSHLPCVISFFCTTPALLGEYRVVYSGRFCFKIFLFSCISYSTAKETN